MTPCQAPIGGWGRFEIHPDRLYYTIRAPGGLVITDSNSLYSADATLLLSGGDPRIMRIVTKLREAARDRGMSDWESANVEAVVGFIIVAVFMSIGVEQVQGSLHHSILFFGNHR